MVTLSPEAELHILIGLAKPLAIEPERYEEFMAIIKPYASQHVENSMNALRERFAKAFALPASSEKERETKLREILKDLLSSDDRDTRMAGSTLRGAVNRIYGYPPKP